MDPRPEVRQRFRTVVDRISAACRQAGRDPSSVRLMAVSKFHPAESIRAVYSEAGRDLGENYPQELANKAEELKDLPGLRWHAIGSLQSNKVPLIARYASAFHALDRLKIAATLGQHRLRVSLGSPLSCYVQVKLSREAQKGGVSEEALEDFLERARNIEGIEIIGLMTLPSFDQTPEERRPAFAKLRELAERHRLSGLSMGMSDDFEVAIAEGATIIRVGTDIFGPRPPKEA